MDGGVKWDGWRLAIMEGSVWVGGSWRVQIGSFPGDASYGGGVREAEKTFKSGTTRVNCRGRRVEVETALLTGAGSKHKGCLTRGEPLKSTSRLDPGQLSPSGILIFGPFDWTSQEWPALNLAKPPGATPWREESIAEIRLSDLSLNILSTSAKVA